MILSIFGCMHECGIIPIVNVTFTRSQNYTNLVVDEHGIQTFEVVVVVCCCFVVVI